MLPSMGAQTNEANVCAEARIPAAHPQAHRRRRPDQIGFSPSIVAANPAQASLQSRCSS